MTKNYYKINEPDGAVQIFIKKVGSLNVPSSINCSIQRTSQSNSNHDYLPIKTEVQFSLGSSEKYCELAIVDDKVLENSEHIVVSLEGATSTLIGKSNSSVVEILDPEDQPAFSFKFNYFEVNEGDGFAFVPIERSGDINRPASVMCLTKSLQAKGANSSLESRIDKDFINKGIAESSKVIFPPGVKVSTCDVRIIDDDTFELDEEFELFLSLPSKEAKIGKKDRLTIRINGPNDESKLAFSDDEITVNENSRRVRISISRTGSHLNYISSVWCATKPYFPQEAIPNIDFIPASKEIIFQKGQETAVFSISIVDDATNPRYEGSKRFKVFMSTPQNASINILHSEVDIKIKDNDDIPKIQFELTDIKVRENETLLKLPLIRSGDLSRVSSVQCFTRQRSAKGGIDFIERPNSKNSTVTFPAGISKVYCEINILDDGLFERKEEFLVKLSNPSSFSKAKPTIGSNRVVRVTLLDAEDKAKISFESLTYTVTEPDNMSKLNYLNVSLIRFGDHSKMSKVWVSTVDGTAIAGDNFKKFRQFLQFKPGLQR